MSFRLENVEYIKNLTLKLVAVMLPYLYVNLLVKLQL